MLTSTHVSLRRFFQSLLSCWPWIRLSVTSVLSQHCHVDQVASRTSIPAGSDDGDCERIFPSDVQGQQLQSSDDYYGPVHFDGHQSVCTDETKESTSSRKDTTSVNPLGADNNEDHSIKNYESRNARSSSLYSMESGNEHMDIANNSSLWVPPEHEDEEDYYDDVACDDDEGEGIMEERGHLRPDSFGSGHRRSRDKSAEEHKKAMKEIVDVEFRALVSQLLQAEKIPLVDKTGKDVWLDIVTSLSWKAASLLKPDTSKECGMDPDGYVKVKCLACGHPSESIVVKGVVCEKNVANRHMPSKMENPRILILGGALEYPCVSNSLSSFDTLLQQETDYLKMAVAKIKSYEPNVVLVEKSVSRYAKDLFLEKNISLVLNIKRPLLERISRCTGAQIVPSIDHLSSQMLGHCDLFHVQKYAEEHGTVGEAGKKVHKALMFFEGCPEPFGCTILLRGANGGELKKVKHVVQYGAFAAYHLWLETSFLVDEGATLPELPLKSPFIRALPDKLSSADRSISTIPILTMPSASSPDNDMQTFDLQNDNLTFNVIKRTGHTVSARSPENNICQRLGVGSDGTTSVEISSQNGNFDCSLVPPSSIGLLVQQPNIFTTDVSSNLHFEGHQSDTAVNDSGILPDYPTNTNLMSVENYSSPTINFGIGDNMAEKPAASLNVQVYHDDDSSKSDSVTKKDEILTYPADNHSILVSLSSRCVWKETLCEMPHLLRMKYYGNFDRLLGRFLRDQLFDQNNICRSCELPPEAHVYCYVHPRGSLSISVRKLSAKLPGEHDGRIWMWHRCFRCPRVSGLPPATKRIVMSDAAWGLSFGKFLELSFSNHASASRVARCGHSLHRDCLRFYGFGEMVACFRYASIKVYSVFLPPPELHFTCQHQECVGQEANEVYNAADLLFSQVLNALGDIDGRPITGSSDGNMKTLESRRNVVKLEEVLLAEKAEFTESLKNLLKKDMGKVQQHIDILEVNKLRRQLLFLCYLWDQRLTLIANYGVKYSDALRGLWVGNRSSDFSDNSVDPNAITKSEISTVSEILSNSAEGSSQQRLNPFHGEDNGIEQEDQSKVVPSHTSLSVRSGALSEDLLRWIKMPYITSYYSLNTRSDSKMGFASLGDYTPLYITLFRELSQQGGARLFLPTGANDTVIPVFDDEPTSVISYALVSPMYHCQLSDEITRNEDSADSSLQSPVYDSGNFNPFHLFDDFISSNAFTLAMSGGRGSFSPDLMHQRVSFEDGGPPGKVKYTVTCYYAKCFEALRRSCCPSELDFVRSISRCKKWGAQGGKSNVFFAKSLDDRFIIKQVTKTELESFLKFGPEYFKYLSDSISTGSPTCLAKILGIYQVTIKHLKGAKESKMDLLVMENLLFERNVTRLYDLKGSSRSRYNADSSGSNKVLLDQNLLEAMPSSPIFVGNKAKRLLERAVWNDTSFLAGNDVMDYSLLLGVDDEKQALVLGIIDFMRQYTWDKHLETWVKSSGLLGWPRNALPTVISPMQYKKRFRKAMTAYFIVVPEQWMSSISNPSKSSSNIYEEDSQNPSDTCT